MIGTNQKATRSAAQIEADTDESDRSAANATPLDAELKNPHLDPKKLFELVSKNYETWLQAMSKQFQDEENFLPFPEDGEGEKDDFNFSLLEALEQASNEFSDKINKLDVDLVEDKVPAVPSSTLDQINGSEEEKNIPSSINTKVSGSNSTADSLLNFSLLKQSEIDFLRTRITQMINSNEFTVNSKDSKLKGYPQLPPPPTREGFSLYDTRDEEGLHEGNTDLCYDDEDQDDENDQDDYDIEEVNNDPNYLYNYSPNTHHFEVELNATPECDVHGFSGCDCPIYDVQRQVNGEEGPACEFTFEYDHTGKLVPVYNNVEEKLRMMNLQLDNSKMKLPSIKELNIGPQTEKKKKKKKKKKLGKTTEVPAPGLLPPRQFLLGNDNCCLFCEYETIFGSKPRQMIKWYEQKMKRDTKRREEIKKKLANAKLRAIKKQRDMRQKQLELQGHARVEHEDDENAEDSHHHEHSHDHHSDCNSHEHSHSHSHVSS